MKIGKVSAAKLNNDAYSESEKKVSKISTPLTSNISSKLGSKHAAQWWKAADS